MDKTWLIVGCEQKPKFIIGVSQCSEDIWREKQNAELCTAAYFHEGVELKFAAAYDSDERQVQQIDSLVESGIDLLIVAPKIGLMTKESPLSSLSVRPARRSLLPSSVPTTMRWATQWVNTSPVDCMAKGVSWKSWDSKVRHQPSSATTVSLMP